MIEHWWSQRVTLAMFMDAWQIPAIKNTLQHTVVTTASPSVGLILWSQVSRESWGCWDGGKRLSAVCEQWEELILSALSATNLVVTPWLHLSAGKVCRCHFLPGLRLAFPQHWPSARSAPLLFSASACSIHFFSIPSCNRPIWRKKEKEDEDRFFQLGGSRWTCWLGAAALLLLLLPPLRSSCSLACTASGKREVVSNF